jgi:hypothetical protein
MEWLNQLNDILANHWAEVLAIFGSTGVLTTFATFIVKLILNKIEAKIKQKYDVSINSKFKEVNDKVDAVANRLVEVVEGLNDKFKETLENKNQQDMVAKRKLYKKITNNEVTPIAVDNEIKVVEPKEEVVEEFIVETQEVAQNENLEAKPSKKKAKRVINE